MPKRILFSIKTQYYFIIYINDIQYSCELIDKATYNVLQCVPKDVDATQTRNFLTRRPDQNLDSFRNSVECIEIILLYDLILN